MAEPIYCELVFGDEQQVLVVSIRGLRGWVEVRGEIDVRDDDPLQQVIDSLPGWFVSSLMCGEVVTIVPWERYEEPYERLLRLLRQG